MSGRSRNSCWGTAKKPKPVSKKKSVKKKQPVLRSGQMIPTMDGSTQMLPYSGEHPCFGQRQEWGCTKQAIWRMNSKHALLHWCEDCKKIVTPKFEDAEWALMEKRPDPARN